MGLHFCAWLLLQRGIQASAPPSEHGGVLVTLLSKPVIRESLGGLSSLDLSHRVVTLDPSSLMTGVSIIPLSYETPPNPGATISAPVIQNVEEISKAPFVREAALLPGESGAVVLRIEVLADGAVGQVDVEVSSGSRQIDAAAVAYVRQLRWNPGRLNGVAQPVWIRWGVTLDG